MFAWVALDRETRAWYEPYKNAFGESYVVCFIGPAYTWQGSKYVPCKTEEEAARGVESFYKQFCELKRQHDELRLCLPANRITLARVRKGAYEHK